MKIIEYAGVVFNSLVELHSEHASAGVTYACFATRIKNGWDIKKALTEKQEVKKRQTFHLNGIDYKDLKTFATAAGISYDAAVKRRDRGFTDSEIFFGRKKSSNAISQLPNSEETGRHSITVSGVIYKNLHDAHEKIQPSASYNTVRQRVHQRKWTLEQALGLEEKVDGRSNPSKKRAYGQSEKTSYTVDGIEYSSVKSLADAYQVSPRSVYNRIRDNKWSAERAVKEPISDCVEVAGIQYRSAMSAWNAVGQTNFPLYQSRKSAGLPLEICLGLAPLPSEDRYELNGKTFASLPEVAVAFDLTAGQLHSRLKTMSLEEAIQYVPANGRYTLRRFEDDPALASTRGVLYFIKIASKDGLLHKIGITHRSVSARFQSLKFDTVALFEGELKKLFLLEQEIIELFRDNHYRADEDFEGKTETFLLMPEEEDALLGQLTRRIGAYGIYRKFTD
jgi:hypothetical protein